MEGGVVGGGSLHSEEENEGRGELAFELGDEDAESASVSEQHESAFAEEFSAFERNTVCSGALREGSVRLPSPSLAVDVTHMSDTAVEPGDGEIGEDIMVGIGDTLAVAVRLDTGGSGVDAFDGPVALASALDGIAGTGTSSGYNAGTGLRRTMLARFWAFGVGLTGEGHGEAVEDDADRFSGENETFRGVVAAGGGR